jgi:hypothetical protein
LKACYTQYHLIPKNFLSFISWNGISFLMIIQSILSIASFGLVASRVNSIAVSTEGLLLASVGVLEFVQAGPTFLFKRCASWP